jgi:DNA-binding IclR family transcriptional regulator
MSSLLARGVAVIERLAEQPEGLPLSAIASATEQPLSATHRLLAELVRLGYVRQPREQGDYALTIKLVSIGLHFLGASGVVEAAQPALDELARTAREGVRMAIADSDELVFVGHAHAAAAWPRHDVASGRSVHLSCSAAGHALLSTMTDEQALVRVAHQGFGDPKNFGPRAPTTVRSLLACIHRARKLGYATLVEGMAPGMSCMAAPVRQRDGPVFAVVTIAGPSERLTPSRMLELAPALLSAAEKMMSASSASSRHS